LTNDRENIYLEWQLAKCGYIAFNLQYPRRKYGNDYLGYKKQ